MKEVLNMTKVLIIQAHAHVEGSLSLEVGKNLSKLIKKLIQTIKSSSVICTLKMVFHR